VKVLRHVYIVKSQIGSVIGHRLINVWS